MRRPDDHLHGPGGCFWVWFAFCAMVGLAFVGLLGWLLVAAIGWLERH